MAWVDSPLGRKWVPEKAPEPEWRPVPDHPHLEQNSKGQWRTKDHPMNPPQPPKGRP